MLAIIDDSGAAADLFATTLRSFKEHAQAIASGKAEGDHFTWFLAAEYQWQMEMACTWLVQSPASRLSSDERETMRHFLASMPDVRQAIITGRRAVAGQERLLVQEDGDCEWADWLAISALPSWNKFTVRTAILLSQLGDPAQNDTEFTPAC
ncbi:MAG TPA: hypothetical protein VN043_12165 [Rhodanobacter sp.]|nr:hypothetical protein [Rhodanobacter sp.]